MRNIPLIVGLTLVASLTLIGCEDPDFVVVQGQVSDQSLIDLREDENLLTLDLSGSAVTNDQLALVAQLPQVQRVYLNETGVADDGLVPLINMPNLKMLSLDSTAITDAGLLHIEQMSQLEGLVITRTQVTKEGVEALRKARPNLAMQY